MVQQRELAALGAAAEEWALKQDGQRSPPMER